MTDEELKAARALCEAATDGPWTGRVGVGGCDYIVKAERLSDADFIAAARTLLPAALDEIDFRKRLTTDLGDSLDTVAAERDALAAEVEAMRPVVEAAIAERDAWDTWSETLDPAAFVTFCEKQDATEATALAYRAATKGTSR